MRRRRRAHQLMSGAFLPQRLDTDNTPFMLVDGPFTQIEEIDRHGSRNDLVHIRGESCIAHAFN